jgi:hypothetical protein
MKYTTDFITNSSSTSFIFSAKKGFSEKDFLKKMGVNPASPLSVFYQALYKSVQDGEDITDAIKKSGLSCSKYLSTQVVRQISLSKKDIAILSSFYKKGGRIILGKLSTDYDGSLGFFYSMERFLFADGDFYFNGLEDCY